MLYITRVNTKVMKSIALIGCGAIGSEIALAIDSSKIDARLVMILDIYEERMDALLKRLRSKPMKVNAIEDIKDVDIVVEAASQDALRSYAEKILERYDLMAMSVGALLDQDLLRRLYDTASKHDTRLYIPTGAIAGIDAIKSVKDLIEYVEIVTTKPPSSLKDAPYIKLNNIDLSISEPKVIYEGYAREAVSYFPANVNVAATLSLAGIGADKTKVKIVADPNIKINRHEIIVRGRFGEFNFRVDNIPSQSNPKTSYLAISSAIECLRSICNDRIRIGT